MPDRTGRNIGEPCLELETLAAYVDGMLDAHERAEVEAHLADCADCNELMSEVLHIEEAIAAEGPADVQPVRELVPDLAPRPSDGTVVRGVFGRPKVVWGSVAAVALAAAAVLLLVVRTPPAWWTSGVDPKLADLVEAVGEERTVEARLTGGFKYGPLRSPTRSGGRVGPTDNWKLLAAAGKIREEAEKNPTPENLHANGVAHLLVGAASESVDLLERASNIEPTNSSYLADLAAAYLARGQQTDSTADVSRAAEAAARALAVRPCMPEASFTNALALERLGALPIALQAWEAFLRCDDTEGWADEAREHVSRLAASSGRPQSSRQPLIEPWLDKAFIATDRCGSGRVSGVLSQAIYADWCAAQVANDVLRMRAVAAIVRAAGLVEVDRRSDAAGELAVTAGHLPKGSSSELLARILRHIASTDSRNALLETDALLTDSRMAQASGYFQAAATGYSFAALSAVRDGRHEDALAARQTARDLMQASGDVSRYAEQEALVGEHYRYVGDFESAWRSHTQSLQRLHLLGDARSRHVVLAHAGLTADAMGLPRLAYALQSHLVANADGWRYAAAIVASRTQRANTASLLHSPEIAASDLEVARGTLGAIDDVAYRRRVAAELHAMEAAVFQQIDPRRAAASAKQALAGFAGIGYDMRLLPLSYTAAASLRRDGHLAEAEETLLEGVEAFGSHLKTSLDSYVGVVDDTIERMASELVTIRVQRGDAPAAALAGARLRSIAGTVDPAKLLRVRELSCAGGRPCAAPSATVALTYVENDDRVSVFAVVDGSTRRFEIVEDVTEISGLVRDVRWQLQVGRYPRQALVRLHHALFSSVGNVLPSGGPLAITPSRSLVGLPFAALLDGDTGRSLVDDWEVTIVSGEEARLPDRALQHPRVAVLGGHPGYGNARLTRVRDEVASVASLYVDDPLRVVPTASQEDVKRAFAESDVIHYAGHAAVPDQRPDLTTLLLWKDGKEIAVPVFRLLRGVRINATTVILAACRTASGMDQSGKATYGLASRLIAAGAESVVGTLWDVPDAETHPMMVRLHAHLSRGHSAPASLRAVQLQARKEDAGFTWAALTAISAWPSVQN